MNLTIPELSLVILIGPSGSGKSTFARRHFKATEILSSDYCRGLISDDENDQTVSKDAFDVLRYIAGKRLASHRLTVVDATNVRSEDRKPLVALAREYHVVPVAIVFDFPSKICYAHNKDRLDRNFGEHVIRNHSQALRRSLRGLKREGFRYIYKFKHPDELEAITLERTPLWTDKKGETGPFDVIGDVHGCYDELRELLDLLGYRVESGLEGPNFTPPEGRRAIFLGDLVDRGPNTPDVLKLVMSMVSAGNAFCIPGNHDVKFLRKLNGKDVQLTHGLADTIQQFENESEEFKTSVRVFLDNLVSHYVFDGGKLVVAHAGMKEAMQGRASGAVREFALYGEATRETDEFGLPVRYNWAVDYRGKATVVYGHTPTPEAEWLNNTICIDTGCVFGGKLTALRYPERELVEVPAKKVYYESSKPISTEPGGGAPIADRSYEDLLDIKDVSGKRVISNRLYSPVTIREENAIAALEVMSRFAVDPHWLIYLPPTMSPCESCKEGEYLEHPKEAFAYFRHNGVPKVICQEKHMGSRAVIVLARNLDSAQSRFRVNEDRIGRIFTRTGRPFFSDNELEEKVLSRIRDTLESLEWWDRFETNWVCLDAELMPWSAKAQALLQSQYAPVGASAKASLEKSCEALETAGQRGAGNDDLLDRFRARRNLIGAYVAAYQEYCWTVQGIDDLKIAPFHLLASAKGVHADKSHDWHMTVLSEMCQGDGNLLTPTPYRIVDLMNPQEEESAIRWWEEITGSGKEGMVVKPMDWVVRGKRGLVQPAIKCRGREYLRIIYGPEYTLPENLERLRPRGLSVKRSLALREFALGLEALYRFVEDEPLFRVHECVFGVLALESEPVDPRL
jgi:protein phosphatase